jgi:hypothetical protein
MNHSHDLSIAWAAGFFDGEGTIGIASRRGGRSHILRVGISQVAKAPIAQFADLFGGRVYSYGAAKAGRQPYFQWIAESAKAATTLQALHPHLLVKDQEAAVALEFYESTPRWGNRAYRPSDAEIARREEFRQALIALHGLQGKNQPRVELSPEQLEARLQAARDYARHYYATHKEYWRGRKPIHSREELEALKAEE